jgi:hypothetical protein
MGQPAHLYFFAIIAARTGLEQEKENLLLFSSSHAIVLVDRNR